MEAAGVLCIGIWIAMNLVQRYRQKSPLFAHWTGIAGFYIALILSAIANHYGVLKTW